jgi:hypothetical protein
MFEYRKAANEAKERKLKGIQSGEPHTKVDSSSWSPPDMLEADKQNGMRPVSPRQYKSGGKVVGAHSKKRADRKARKEGGRAMSVDGYINRDSKMANDERAGIKKIGGMKSGGRAHKAMAGAVGQAPVMMAPMGGRPMRGIRPAGPMMARPVGAAPAMAGRPPMMKKGGRAHKLSGGALQDYLDAAKADLAVSKAVGDDAGMARRMAGIRNASNKMSGVAKAGNVPFNYDANVGGMKKGGKVAHSDEAQDKKLMHKLLKEKAFKADGGAMHHKDCSCKMCSGGRAGKAHGGGEKWIQGAIKHPGSLHKALHVPEGEKIPAKKLEKAAHSKNPTLAKKANLAKTLKRFKHADGGEAGRGLYVRQGYPHEVPGVDGGRIARKDGGRAKGKTNINIMINPKGAMDSVPPAMPPMGGPMMPPPPPPPPRPPLGVLPVGAMPMGGMPMPAMGAARPGMPPIGRKHGGNIPAGMHTMHVIDNAAGGGLGRLEKIKAYGLD